MIWHITYQRSTNSFRADPAREICGSPVVFTGDEEHVTEANAMLRDKLQSRGKLDNLVKGIKKPVKFEWEPFEVIRDMLSKVNANPYEFQNSSIGGAPQVLKIYEHLSSQKFGVLWMNRMDNEPSIYLSGRKLINYGLRDMWVLNPDKLITYNPLKSNSNKEVINQFI